ncbi:response regulator [bacterium]|nr:response regulator [bacterium]
MTTEKKQVWVIDDEPLALHMYARVMRKINPPNATIHYFEAGEAALEFLNGGKAPNLIFLDLEMPNMSGLEFLHLLMSRLENPEKSLQVLIVSSKEIDHSHPDIQIFPVVKAVVKKPITRTSIKLFEQFLLP